MQSCMIESVALSTKRKEVSERVSNQRSGFLGVDGEKRFDTERASVHEVPIIQAQFGRLPTVSTNLHARRVERVKPFPNNYYILPYTVRLNSI